MMMLWRGASAPLHRAFSSLTSLKDAAHSKRALLQTHARPFSTTDDTAAAAPSEQPTPPAEAAAETASAETPAAAAPPPPPSGPTQEELIAQGFSKRMAARIAPDPAKQKHFLPRLNRKERGSYGTEAALNQFAQEVDLYPKVPDVPLYNLREVVPEMVQPKVYMLEALEEARKANPEASIVELAAMVGLSVPPPQQLPAPGSAAALAGPILEWEVRLVLSAGAAGEQHPKNKKAKCRVHLRALQRQCGLSDSALERIAEISGPRYDGSSGILTLTSERYQERELNRKHILKMLRALVDEGEKWDAAGEQHQKAA